MLVSFIGCIAGTLATKPTDEETLINFYFRVRPWGFWQPIARKAIARYPEVKRNMNFKRDMFNVGIGIIWQSCLTIIPMYIVIKEGFPLLTSVLILGITTLILKKNWYDKMNREENEYDALMAKINSEEKKS
jgi:heme/copper-type cytochrome/quinol oxidase subunit 4